VAKLEKILADLNPWPELITVGLQALNLEAMKSLYEAVVKGEDLLKDLENKFSTLLKALRDNMDAAAAREREAVEASKQLAQEGAHTSN
jgi:hypothetical protein